MSVESSLGRNETENAIKKRTHAVCTESSNFVQFRYNYLHVTRDYVLKNRYKHFFLILQLLFFFFQTTQKYHIKYQLRGEGGKEKKYTQLSNIYLHEYLHSKMSFRAKFCKVINSKHSCSFVHPKPYKTR